jgi:hypothetical protein
MDAISARLRNTSRNPAATMRNPQIRPAVPPSVRPCSSRLDSQSLNHRGRMDSIRQNNLPCGDQRAAKPYDGDVSEVTLQGQLRCMSHNHTKRRTRKTCSFPRALISAWSAWVPRHLGATWPLDWASSARVMVTADESLFQGILTWRQHRRRRFSIKDRGNGRPRRYKSRVVSSAGIFSAPRGIHPTRRLCRQWSSSSPTESAFKIAKLCRRIGAWLQHPAA